MIIVLRILGWLGLSSCLLNISIKLFASMDVVKEYAGSDRNLNAAVLGVAFSIIFLALAKILSHLEASNNPPKA
jgi:hypothetical protein